MSGDYEVGYGKPPVHTRFKKGQSGNPSGKAGPRKMRRRRFAEILDVWMFRSPEAVARTRCATPFSEMAQGMILDAARGKTGAIRTIFTFLDELDGTAGRKRPTALDERLEEAEWEEEAADLRWEEAANLSWNKEKTNTQPMGISHGNFEKEKRRTWCEFAEEVCEGEGEIDREGGDP